MTDLADLLLSPMVHRLLPGRLLRPWLRLNANRARQTPLAAYLRALEPLLGMAVARAPMMALDLEMTGLDPRRDQLLSIGLVPIEAGELLLAGARQVLVRIDASVGHSATLHGIVDRELAQAMTQSQAMDWLLTRTRGRLLVAHNAPLDLSFIRRRMQLDHGLGITLPAVDTLRLERRRLLRQAQDLTQGSLRLGACRSRYGLPGYAGHHALGDALACGELLLAQLSAMGDGLTVAELLRLSS
ncbi:3'-5' exonuclease [Shewanella sp. AS16]|nr:exonuclease domain-containing protein [Shewanella sp. AS16]MCE9686915.1 3'-5' exonuclease [Shewanella sp. AS16]